VACSIHGVVAADAPVIVLFRRGPTLRTELVRWDTSRDTFEAGQWLHGRVYTRRCGLSPDGALLVYFAAKHGSRRAIEEGCTEAWTAVSRPPYFTALALWPKGDTWDGGGWFSAPRELHLNHHAGQSAAHPDHSPARQLRVHLNAGGRGEDLPILDDVLSAGGWWRVPAPHDGGPLRAVRGPHVWLRRHPREGVLLRMEFEGWNPKRAGGPIHFGYSLATPEGDLVEVLDATWADWDQAGRLVYTDGGRVFAREAGAPARCVADLTADTPRAVIAPAWAATWPKAPPLRRRDGARRPARRPRSA
jgi:hypothetical protein